jgi:tyrosine-protein kinase Etk/Wzc
MINPGKLFSTMTSDSSTHQQDESDLEKLVAAISRNYRLIATSLAITLIIAFLVNHLMTPQYKIAASLLIKVENKKLNGNVNDFLNSSLFGGNQNFQNELWVLKSVPVIDQTIRNLNLNIHYFREKIFRSVDAYDKIPFRIVLISNHVQPVGVRFKISFHDKDSFLIKASAKNIQIVDFANSEVVSTLKKWTFIHSGKFGELVETPDLSLMVTPDTVRNTINKEDNNYSFVLEDIISETDKLKKRLEFTIIDKLATVIEIKFRSPSPKEGKDIVNEIMKVYSEQNLARKNHTATITIDYIEKQLGEISDSLSITEENLQRFRSSNQLLNVNEQAIDMSKQYMDLQNQMAELVTRKRYYDNVAEYLEKNEDFSNMVVPASMGITDPLLNDLMSELITAHAQRSNLIQNNQELNPLVQKLTIQIENTKKTISENITAVRKTTDISLEEMTKRIDKIEASINRLPKTQRQLGNIERKFTLNDAIYNYLLEKRAEAKITQASNQPDDIVIAPAKLVSTKPVFPNKGLNYGIAIFLGLLIPFGYLTLKSTLDNKIESEEYLEHFTNLPLMGKIIHTHHKNVNEILEHPGSALAESYRSLRTNLEYHFKDMHSKVILITSCVEGEGKTFIAINLAMSYVQLGQRILLLDFDLRRPTASYFGIVQDSQTGLSSWYSNGTNLNEILWPSPFENLDYIASGPLPPNPLELMAQDKTGSLLRQLKSKYDCIIVDTSPLAQVSDAYLLMDHADVKIVIARCNFTIKRVFSLIMKKLKEKNVSNLCIVLNDNRIYDSQYGYGYGYKNNK